MGLLASIVAYLSVVAAIVIGFIMSADALLHHSHHHAINPGPEIAAAAKADTVKTKKAVKPARKTVELRAIPQRSTVTAYRRKTELSNSRREPHKGTVHDAQRRYWPPQREHTAAPRALGYADEPPFSGDPWRY